jgi:uncharacterized protein YbjT (DUF2867 family)
MNATIIGSTGLTGSFLLQHLLADPAITQVISVSRSSSDLSDAKLTEILIDDLSALPSIEADICGDMYFCCLGTTIKTAGSRENFKRVDHDAVVTFAQIAKAHNARSFTLVSAMGASARSGVFYNRVKGQTEDDVKALGLPSLNIFRPALLTGPRSEFRLGEKIATSLLVPLSCLMPAPARKKITTPANTLAMHMLGAGKMAAGGVHITPAAAI